MTDADEHLRHAHIDTAKRFGLAVFHERMERGETQKEFALRCEMRQSSISHIECGIQSAGLHTARRIATGLGLTLAQLIARAGL